MRQSDEPLQAAVWRDSAPTGYRPLCAAKPRNPKLVTQTADALCGLRPQALFRS